jgi:hypothetical protein
LRVLAALERPPAAALPGCADKDWGREQVACVLSCSPDYAGHRLVEASLVARHPQFLALLAAGDVNMGHVRVFAETLAPLDERGAQLVAARVLPSAAGQGVSRFRAALRRAALTACPVNEQQQRAANVEDRCVRIRPHAPGVSSLWAVLPEADAAAIATAITTLANTTLAESVPAVGTVREGDGDRDRDGDELRSADQRRADALVQLILTGEHTAALGGAQPLRPLIQVSVALSTLLGLDQQPAELDGVGPIPAALARRLADDPTGTWRRLTTDPHGQVLDVGRRSYRPPPPWPTTSAPATRSADSHTAPAPPNTATSTTAPPGPTAAPPAPRTCTCSAPATTTSNTKQHGTSTASTPTPPTGPAPPARATPPHPPSPTPPTPRAARPTRPSSHPTGRRSRTFHSNHRSDANARHRTLRVGGAARPRETTVAVNVRNVRRIAPFSYRQGLGLGQMLEAKLP